MNDLSYLYVEGKTDFHVIKNLLKVHEIKPVAVITDKNKSASKKTGVIYINAFGDDEYTGRGIEELKSTFTTTINKTYDVSNIGIVVDADDNVNARWDALCNIAKGAGDCVFPTQPSQSGCITTIVRQKKPPIKLGIWIMPDNENGGMLEHFISDLIPDDNFLWQKAEADVIAIPETERLFPSVHTQKAKIHTWLAWQKTPGRPMGIGITAGWFDHQSPLAQSFIAWIKELFRNED